VLSGARSAILECGGVDAVGNATRGSLKPTRLDTAMCDCLGVATGLELSRQFYQEAVRPVLDAAFPGMAHSAALLGRGSEVLGFDDEMSRDHDWVPRVRLFLREDDYARHGDGIREVLRRRVPGRFQGQSTDFALYTVRGYILAQLNFDIDGEITARDWLSFPERFLAAFTGGAVYHDEIGLQAVRDRYGYYPRDVWIYLLSAGWWRVHPEANIVGRVGFVGDELGSALIASRLVHDLMRLCFLMERKYAPYSKWFGTAFSRLPCAVELSPILQNVIDAGSWSQRENALMAAYEKVAAMHNALRITEPVAIDAYQLWNRPFTVVWGDFINVLRAEIKDPEVQHIAERWPTGPVDRFREMLWHQRDRKRLLRVFD
jgi:hypothetical protein